MSRGHTTRTHDHEHVRTIGTTAAAMTFRFAYRRDSRAFRFTGPNENEIKPNWKTQTENTKNTNELWWLAAFGVPIGRAGDVGWRFFFGARDYRQNNR